MLYNNEPLEKVRHGKAMTLKDHGIRSSSTLIVTKLGITLNVINPQVRIPLRVVIYKIFALTETLFTLLG